MKKLNVYTAEIFTALAGVLAVLLISLIPSLEPLKESIIAIIIIAFGLIFGTQIKKGLVGRTKALAFIVPDYWAEIITALVGTAVAILVQYFPDFVPYQNDLVTIVIAVVFAILEIGFGLTKGLQSR